MDFLSKPIGVRIMEKFKIYVHHNYSYERFWYFFHGVDVDINDVVTHTNMDNAFNKQIPITYKVNIKCKYKNNNLDITFVGKTDWHLEGHHLLDYSIDLYDRNLASDRGYNSNIRWVVDKEYIPLLNKFSKYDGTKYHFMYIDWEGHNTWYEHKMDRTLSKDVNVYVDEIDDENIKTRKFVFTNTIMSFIYPNTLGLKDYIHFADILKYKNDYKHKINYPIRRFYRSKLILFNKIMKLEDRHINVTHSSFHDTSHYAGWRETELRDDLKIKIGKENFIEKRGYGIDDWGGEWNDNNVSEFMWKMFSFAEVNILPEYNPFESMEHGDFKDDLKMIGESYMTEKTISHIFANKPFIPISYNTIKFYESMLEKNNIETVEFPFKYSDLTKGDSIIRLNEIAKNEEEWNDFVKKLKNWNSHLRKSILDLVNYKNDLLDILIKSKFRKPNSNII